MPQGRNPTLVSFQAAAIGRDECIIVLCLIGVVAMIIELSLEGAEQIVSDVPPSALMSDAETDDYAATYKIWDAIHGITTPSKGDTNEL